MHYIDYPNASKGVKPRPNDHALQANWKQIARIIPPDSLPVNIFEVLEGFWRSCLPFPQQLAEIAKLGIRHILALTECRDLYSDAHQRGLLPDNLTIHHSPYNQRHYLTFSEIIKLTRLIHKLRQDGGVLVHCIAGVTRAGSVVSAYTSAVLNHVPADDFEGFTGLRDVFVRWFDFMSLSGSLHDQKHTELVRSRFTEIQKLSDKLGISIPDFLKPRQFYSVNLNTLREVTRYGDIGDVFPHLFSTGNIISSPISPLHRQMVLPGHSLGIEIPSREELLTT